ncbi:MAG: hypothetical protein QNL04_06495 [SAR324 cluster bacterium]|nr:hypothetical protein [SAR324 cluster bacterium]
MFPLTINELLSAIAIALTFIAFYPYLRSIHKGETKPHYFSWVIWGLTTLVVFFAQLGDQGGVGSWPIGLSGILTLYVALVAFLKRSDSSITSLDWWLFLMALSALPLWYFTSNALWAVVLLTFVDTLGFGPTFRKAYNFPLEENLSMYEIMALRNLIASLALEHYSIITLLFPTVSGVSCLVFVAMVRIRRLGWPA